jgi:hypothetical protein
MKTQHHDSITHRNLIASGLSIIDERHTGEGDSAISVIRYSNGATYVFDNGSATQIGDATPDHTVN